MRERIKRVFELTGLSQQDFAKRLGISAPTLSSLFSGRTQPNARQVEAIHRGFPEINVGWLMFGEGEMLLEGAQGNLFVGSEGTLSRSRVEQMGENPSPSSVKRETFPSPGPENASFSRGNRLEASLAAGGLTVISGAQGAIPGQNVSPGAERKTLAAEQMGEFLDRVHLRPRQIEEIRVFFDDGTYEVFSIERK